MKWRGRQQSSNIEDRRGQTSGGLGGLGGNPFGRSTGGGMRLPTGGGGSRGGMGSLIGIVVVLGIIWVVTGTNPLDMLSGGTTTSSSPSQATRPVDPNDDTGAFVRTVLRETELSWGKVFEESGEQYPQPILVLFDGQTTSGCGTADSRTGPFYCPQDQKVYVDLSFYDQLRTEFGAPGDFAQAYVLAHEVGHHIQNITGVLPEFNRQRQSLSAEQANAYSVRIELQADCYAGIWANSYGREGLMDSGDFEEALNAADQIGDDTLQKRMQGFAVPKTFNHGTSAQRKAWFERGYKSGNPDDCDTFSGSV